MLLGHADEVIVEALYRLLALGVISRQRSFRSLSGKADIQQAALKEAALALGVRAP